MSRWFLFLPKLHNHDNFLFTRLKSTGSREEKKYLRENLTNSYTDTVSKLLFLLMCKLDNILLCFAYFLPRTKYCFYHH